MWYNAAYCTESLFIVRDALLSLERIVKGERRKIRMKSRAFGKKNKNINLQYLWK